MSENRISQTNKRHNLIAVLINICNYVFIELGIFRNKQFPNLQEHSMINYKIQDEDYL